MKRPVGLALIALLLAGCVAFPATQGPPRIGSPHAVETGAPAAPVTEEPARLRSPERSRAFGIDQSRRRIAIPPQTGVPG